VAFGQRLAAARDAKEIPQHQLAQRLRLSRTSISNIECGSRGVFLDQIYQAAEALGVDARSLLPPMEEIFPPTTVHSVSDDGVSPDSAMRVVRRVEERLATESGEAARPRRTR